MEGKYIIVDMRSMEIFKDLEGKIYYYDTEEDASFACGMYEFENAWVIKLIYNHKETI